MNQYTYKQHTSPILVMIVCFVIIVFSIDQIINLAQPTNDIRQKLSSMGNNELTQQVSSLTQSSTILNGHVVTKKLSNLSIHDTDKVTKLNIYFNSPQLTRLPIAEQNYLIRIKLLEWKLNDFQEQLNIIATQPSCSLLSKIPFWIFSFIIWVASVIFGRILTNTVDSLCRKYNFPKKN